MKNVTIYIKPTCPFCKKALLVLKRHGVDQPNIIDLSSNPNRRQEAIKRSSGRTTVPQIFFGDDHIGGCDDLLALEKSGVLAERLQ